MWIVTKQTCGTEPQILYADNRKWKAATKFAEAVARGNDTTLFRLVHDSHVVDEAKGGRGRLNPNVTPVHIPPTRP